MGECVVVRLKEVGGMRTAFLISASLALKESSAQPDWLSLVIIRSGGLGTKAVN